jgi:hypothetical protein
MAEEQEGLPSNPAQMMVRANRQRAEDAAQAGMAKRASVEEGRTASGRQAAEDIGDFTPEEEELEMEGGVELKKGSPAPKYIKGEGGFEYLYDPEANAFTITKAPKDLSRLAGKKVTSGKAFDSIMAEMKTGKSLYEDPGGDAAPIEDEPPATPELPEPVGGESAREGEALQYGLEPGETILEPFEDPQSVPPVSVRTPSERRAAAVEAAFLPALEEAEAGEKRRAGQSAVERAGRMTGSMDNPFG